jgi:isopentenyl phosphate kinase
MDRMLVLKLGGSLLTDKSRPYSLRTDVLHAASTEIKTCLDQGLFQKLVIVHGVGSYGHPPVIEYKLHKGFINPDQLLPLSRTQSKVNELRAEITSSLQDVGIPVNLFHTSSIAIAKKGRIISMDLNAVKGFLNIGMVPVLGGDIVPDIEMGFSVGSGDQVAALLTKQLGATDLVFATDVDGVYDLDPKTSHNARLIRDLSLSHMGVLDSSGSEKGDASGAMRGKLLALTILEEELHQGLKMSIISMKEPGRLSRLLKGVPVEATHIGI